MCTVTLIPKGENDFILTSNRDEAPNRSSLAPDFYTIKNTKMLFPKDEKAGGTWIGVSAKNRLICLLNGGFYFHKRKEAYRISRGVVLTDLLAAEVIETALKDYNLQDVEPFTLVITDWNAGLKFFEFVWDGTKKHLVSLPKEPKIWSSASLYSEIMKQEREQWFQDFKKANSLDSKKILQFHKTTHLQNTEYGVIMNRGFVKTTSITQIEKTKEAVSMNFENFQDKIQTRTTFLFPETIIND